VFDTKAALTRLAAIGITPNQAHQILQLVGTWSSSSGEEWTVSRLKAIKLDLLRRASGLPPLKAHTWIKYDSTGVPKGAFGIVFRLAELNFAKAWNVLMLYTGFTHDHPTLRVTSKQWKKAITAIRRSRVEPEALVEGLRLVHTSPFYVPISIMSDTGSPLVYQPASETRRAPTYYRTVPEWEGVVESLSCLLRKSIWTSENWDILSGVCAGLEDLVLPIVNLNLEDEARAGGPLPQEIPDMGIIALIPEPGYKLRFAANPMRVYQAALEPLKEALFAALKRVPNDFTFDQEAGVRFIQRYLRDGYPAASMDLSNATDNAPLALQLELLSRCGVSTRWLQFFESCCRGDWVTNRYKRSQQWEHLQWTVGSPLGLGPTFASFALWHHSLVQACFADRGVKPNQSGELPYAILGDDIVIMDFNVAELYRERMVALGIPISEDKTLWSYTLGEFASRIVSSERIVQGVKWKGRATDESFVDLCRNIGPGALALLKPRQRRVISFIADLPEPYGLGWNPYGIPLCERLTPELERAWSREERVQVFHSRASRINRLLYGYVQYHGAGVPPMRVDVGSFASDQDVADVVGYYMPGFDAVPMYFAGNALEVACRENGSVPPAIRRATQHVTKRNSTVERRSETPTLVVLERKLRRATRWVSRARARIKHACSVSLESREPLQ